MLREGDFGIDYFLDPGNVNSAMRPVFSIYAFHGSADIYPYGREGVAAYFGGAPSIAVAGWESLRLDIASSYTYADKKPMETDIVNYWRLHNFSGTPPGVMPLTSINEPMSLSPVTPLRTSDPVIMYIPVEQTSAPQKTPSVRSNAGKNLLLSIGFGLTTTSVVAREIAYTRFDTGNDSTARMVHGGSLPTLGLGLVLTLAGILYNPAVK